MWDVARRMTHVGLALVVSLLLSVAAAHALALWLNVRIETRGWVLILLADLLFVLVSIFIGELSKPAAAPDKKFKALSALAVSIGVLAPLSTHLTVAFAHMSEGAPAARGASIVGAILATRFGDATANTAYVAVVIVALAFTLAVSIASALDARRERESAERVRAGAFTAALLLFTLNRLFLSPWFGDAAVGRPSADATTLWIGLVGAGLAFLTLVWLSDAFRGAARAVVQNTKASAGSPLAAFSALAGFAAGCALGAFAIAALALWLAELAPAGLWAYLLQLFLAAVAFLRDAAGLLTLALLGVGVIVGFAFLAAAFGRSTVGSLGFMLEFFLFDLLRTILLWSVTALAALAALWFLWTQGPRIADWVGGWFNATFPQQQTEPAPPITPGPAAAPLVMRWADLACAWRSDSGARPIWSYGDDQRVAAPVETCFARGAGAAPDVVVAIGLASGEGQLESESSRALMRGWALARTLRTQLGPRWDGRVYVLNLGRLRTDAAASSSDAAMVGGEDRRLLAVLGFRADGATPPSEADVLEAIGRFAGETPRLGDYASCDLYVYEPQAGDPLGQTPTRLTCGAAR